MRIGIDCRLAGPDHAGIGRYTAELVKNLLEIRSSVDWVLFLNDQKQLHSCVPEKAGATHEVILAPFRHYSIAEQLQLPKYFANANLDLLHVPHFNVPLGYRGRFCITIHDLLWHHHRGIKVTTLSPWVYWTKYLGYRFVTNNAVNRAATVFVPSNTIAKTITEYYPKATKKIVITREGVQLEQPEQLKQVVPKNYLLFVGSLYPHKNIGVVFKALQSLPNHHIVLVGSRSVFSSEVLTMAKLLGIENRVHFYGRATEGELSTLYSQALALVQPSLSEGFGLTGIEAMAAGTPVIASDIPVFREVYQKAALFCQPQDPEDFLRAIRSISKEKSTLIKNGKQVAKAYSWKNMAQTTFNEYLKIAQQ